MNEYEITIAICYVENRGKKERSKLETIFAICQFFVQTNEEYSHYLPLWWENFQLNKNVLKSTSTKLP